MMTRLGFACAAAMIAPELQSAKVVPSDYKYPHASTSLPSKPQIPEHMPVELFGSDFGTLS